MTQPFYALVREAPCAPVDGPHIEQLRDLEARIAERADLAALSSILSIEPVRSLMLGVFVGSPYLRALIVRDLDRFARVMLEPPDTLLAALQDELQLGMTAAVSVDDAMRALRKFKSCAALLVALADLAGIWPVMRVTEALSRVADTALQSAVTFLFRQAQQRGDWIGPDTPPEQTSGYFVLAMGKYGAFELNYSSDIDLIVFFDTERAQVRDGLDVQTFFVRVTRDLIRLMDERTPDGYVFRTDLRLRPDAGATQIALSTDAALIYYEGVGQNWERAALIKARVAAGDLEAGNALLELLQPFVWRKYLDFAAIADVHAMKRQINVHRGFGGISVPGHNVKLGPGGIREIEFFAQTQQLIAGGRQKDLRLSETLLALDALNARGWITDDARTTLKDAYLFLRRLEHRLQMMADEQTHEIPSEPDALERTALFCGYQTSEAFERDVRRWLQAVEGHYRVLFEHSPDLTSAGANMVFAGETDDPATVQALARMGFSQPSSILASVRGWHHGRFPAVRTARARERLTEVQPQLIAALGETADPDRAFGAFDRFVSSLPDGVQLFSLLAANPNLVRLLASILGTAPRLAGILARRRRLLDAVIDPRTFSALPSRQDLDALIESETSQLSDFQELLDRVRVVGQEQAFLIGVRVLTGSIHAGQAGAAYAVLAERLIARLQDAVVTEIEQAHGRVPGGAFAVVAMGKLGGLEMTASSDLDLIMVYDFDPMAQQSDGTRPLSPGQYYARLTQRLITALSAPTAEGLLYEVDTRLRPSGQKGPLATQLSSFDHYQTSEAWTWEHMALTRARVISGPTHMRRAIEDVIARTLTKPRERAQIAADVLSMRSRIEADKGTKDIWDLKQVRGGLVDIEFIVQYVQLIQARDHPSVLDQNTLGALSKLEAAGVLNPQDASDLTAASKLLHDLGEVLRLCLDGPFDPAVAAQGLKQQLAIAGGVPSFPVLETTLRETQARVASLFTRLIV